MARRYQCARLTFAFLAIIVTAVGCKSETDDKFPIAIAFGVPPTGQFEMHVGVDMGMRNMEPPKLNNKGTDVLWDEWVQEHFKLVDANKKTMKLSRANNSRLMPTNKIAGTFEFFLTTPVKKGAEYELTYQPRLAEKVKYRKTFKPDGPTDPLRMWFEPVGKAR